MAQDLNNHKFLVKLNKLSTHTKSNTQHEFTNITEWFNKFSLILILMLIIIHILYVFTLTKNVDYCNPARSETEWEEHNCVEIIGKTWMEYAWPNNY